MLIKSTIFLVVFVIQISLSSLAASLDNILSPPQLADGWSTDSAQNAGFDQAKIQALANALTTDEYLNVHAVLIERNGKLVYEQYLSGFDQSWGYPLGDVDYDGSQQHDLRSISKSVTSLLLGMALETDFKAKLDRPLLDYLAGQAKKIEESKDRITLRQVLTMSAGFDWNEMDVPYSNYKNDEIQLYRTSNPIAYVLNKALRNQPDERWYYNGGMTMLAGAVVEQLTGKQFLRFARQVLFDPLGIDEFTWHRSSGWPTDSMPAVASGLRLLPRDLAKIGSLMINKGKWRGKQIVPEKWISLSQQRFRDDMQPWDYEGTYGYGLQWWQGNFPYGEQTVSTTTGVGYGGQRLFTAADIGLSVTIHAGNYGTGRPRSTWQSERIYERILDALSR